MDASLRRSRRVAAALLALTGLTLASCGNFSTTDQTFTAQPSLTAPMVTPVVPPPLAAGTTSGSGPSPSPSGSPSSSAGTTTSAPADPCKPVDPVVVAACLAAPWGLAPLPDGTSALVGERTTGRILKVAPGQPPIVVTTIAGIDAAGSGGLLGIAVSPSYLEDGLIYAYVTTATDNRVLRIAAGDKPKAILAGIPKGADNGGALAFTAQSVLYVGTGDGGSPSTASTRTSLAGKLLRIDEFGKPAEGNPDSTSPVFAVGFTQITGICLLPTGAMAAVDHRPAADVLVAAKAGRNYSTLGSGDAVWTWKAGDGGAADCASADGVLANTSLAKQQLIGITMSTAGAFSGTPRVLLDKKYGRLLTVEAGAKGAVWMTTSNKDGHGKPVAADDRVLLLPDAGRGGGNGPD